LETLGQQVDHYSYCVRHSDRPSGRGIGDEATEEEKNHLQMENSKPHVEKLTRFKIQNLNWEILLHPSYSPDLAPSDYHLFRFLKREIDGKEFHKEDDLKKWCQQFFHEKPKIFWERVLRSLPVKWATVVETNGAYLE
jgi:hypothetical protein